MYRAPFASPKGIVATEEFVSSVMGYKVLELGGNAVDAAVVTSLSLSLTIPHLGGIGGDFFALIYNASEDKIYYINGSGHAPHRMNIEAIRSLGYSKMPESGPLSITIPGLVDGLHEMWRRFGSVEWSDLLRKVHNLAVNGFPASNSLLTAYRYHRDKLLRDPGSRRTYQYLDNALYGGNIRFDGFCELLRLISEDPRAFYEGDIAESISEYVEARGGLISYDDLRRYRAEWMSPIRIEYRDSAIYEMPPNTQGLTTLHILKLLEERGHRMDPNSTERIKRYLDIYKIAYFIRDNYVTDPRYMKLNVEEMLSIDFIKGVIVRGGSGQGSNSNGDTTYFCIADKDGNMVSGVQSIFYPFGSYLTEPKYCITLNSRASSFVLDKEHVNSLQPDKKPLHTLSDLIVKTSDNILALGLSGGHFRPQLHALILTNILDYNMDIQTALEYPRFVWIPGTRDIRVEKGYEERGIENYNVDFLSYPSRLGVAAACISRADGVKIGYTDIRGEGIPLGPI